MSSAAYSTKFQTAHFPSQIIIPIQLLSRLHRGSEHSNRSACVLRSTLQNFKDSGRNATVSVIHDSHFMIIFSSFSLEADLILQVVKCSDVPEKEPKLLRPKTPGVRMLTSPIRQEPL